ncbi:putative ATP-dependent RNA helicase Dbp73D [Amphibalanus amphitrite]|uniref:Putative ATP-dependent RNA helicase Dbp73D n=1 Tax=Amphibalanus amphitrite TaxID=1232801 RepID=A0A6A4W5R2_AMPAM|nr:putative ATP-dependent RNA helicase Dbp73D [Amphibalanus amphitrite]
MVRNGKLTAMLATLADSSSKMKQVKKEDQLYTVCRPNTGVQVPAVFRQYDADTPLCVRLLGGDTVARGGANWWRTRRPEKLERMSLFQPRLLVAGTVLPGQFVGRFTTPAELSESFNVVVPQPLKPLLMHNLLRQPD